MSDGNNNRVAGFVLVGAALLGVIGMAVLGPKSQGAATGARSETSARKADADSSARVDSAPPIMPVEREHLASPFNEAASDSVTSRCVAAIRDQLTAPGGDTAGVEVSNRYGVRPPPGRGPDSLVVEGTAPGRDSTRAVWHCAATKSPSGEVATFHAVLEDGWPSVPARFPDAHAVSLAAEDFCLQRTKLVLREYEFRGVNRVRIGNTLRVTGQAMPLNAEDLAADFRCSAIVRDNRVISAIAATSK